MRLAVVGGRLQGTEAAYLAGEAGFDVVLIDRRSGTPASGLAGETHVLDVSADPLRARELLGGCDAVLPACENEQTLAWLARTLPAWEVPLLFDLDAYELTSSKLRSNRLFADLDVPRPAPWPSCPFPVVVKPSVGSGSHRVRVVRCEPELALARAEFASRDDDVVVEEFMAGRSLSLEVLAAGGGVAVLQATGLEFDADYDCKRVTAPVQEEGGVTAATLAAFDEATATLAGGLGLTGIMDVEVMVRDGVPKVLEIDARLPSQTPAAVFHSSDLNIVAALVETFAEGRPPAVDRSAKRGAVYQHVLVERGRVEVLGERIVSSAGPLRRRDGLWGADVVLSDADGGEDRWVAIMMTRAASLRDARAKADEAVARLAREQGLEVVPEREPYVKGVR